MPPSLRNPQPQDAHDAHDVPPPSYKLADGPMPFSLEAEMAVLLSYAGRGCHDPALAARTLVSRQLADLMFEPLTPAELLAHRGDPAYDLAIDALSFRVGYQGTFLIDADFIVRETRVGYPVAVIWANNSLADDAERIAYWAGQIDLAHRHDMRVCVLTRGADSPYPPAETERREAMVLSVVEKAYWMGDGHPSDDRLTRFADFEDDVCVSRNYVLHE